MLDLMFFLLLGHFLGDFAFQTGRMAKYKPTSLIVLTTHVAVYTVTLAGLLLIGLYFNDQLSKFFSLTTLAVLVAVFVEHWFQDWIKGTRCQSIKQVFFLDQALHIVVLFLMRLLVYHV